MILGLKYLAFQPPVVLQLYSNIIGVCSNFKGVQEVFILGAKYLYESLEAYVFRY